MLLAAFSALCLSASAQITITNATFPVAGDTLVYSVDNNPVGINPATAPGTDQVWMFGSLTEDAVESTVFSAANTGMHSIEFPGAELVIKNIAGESYFNVTSSQFEALGFAGTDPNGFGLDVNIHYTPSLLERWSPMMFLDLKNITSSLSMVFPTDQPPLDAFFAGLPVNVDSMRIRRTTARQNVVNAWGTCQIPGGSYPVLRNKQTDYITTALDLHAEPIPGFGYFWVDATNFIPPGSGGGLGDLIGTDTVVTYKFLSGTEKEEIASAQMNNDQTMVANVRYKKLATTDAADLTAPGTASISAFPNPAIDWVRFDYVNLPSDEYTLKIFNIIGKEVWKETYQLTGTDHFRVELDKFKKGTYLYSLANKKGNVIGTKRLVVLKP